MKTEITYGQLEDALISLGFEKHTPVGRGTYFTHPTSDAIVSLTRYDCDAVALERHLVVTQAVLDNYGFLNGDEFLPFVRSRGKVAS